jgi:hypothetical protein
VERGRGAGGVERAVAANRFLCGENLDLDAPAAKAGDRIWVRLQASVYAGAEDEPLGELVEDVLEIFQHQAVPVPAPPVPYDALGEDDDVPRVLLSVDRDVPEPVALDSRHDRMITQRAGA